MTKNELKYIQSFAHKKHWSQESVFIVEGPKLMEELLHSDWKVIKFYATAEWATAHSTIQYPIQIVAPHELDARSEEHTSELQSH